jgi:DNA-binding NtrC family response regulator
VGLCSSLASALEAVQSSQFDIVLLDVSQGMIKGYPIAKHLDAVRKPFVLLSGHGEAAPPNHPDWRVCFKPFHLQELEQAILQALKAKRAC